MKALSIPALAVLLSYHSSIALADFLVFSETFDTDTSTTAETIAAYPKWTFSVGADRETFVQNGVLYLTPQDPHTEIATVPGFAGNLVIEADLGRTTPESNYNTGLVIGQNWLIFHPGLGPDSGYPEGSFRVDGPGGFLNQDMGFDPAAGNVLHHLRVTVDASSGVFGITLTDANNPSNVYTTSFTNPGYTPGDPIGFITHGTLLDYPRYAIFDNLTISSTVPEPSTVGLAIASFVGFLFWGLTRWKPNRR